MSHSLTRYGNRALFLSTSPRVCAEPVLANEPHCVSSGKLKRGFVFSQGFLFVELESIERKPGGTEADRLAAIDALLSWEDAGPGGYYDNLAPLSSGGLKAGHLDPGQGPKADPAYYFSPLTTAKPDKPQNATRLSWQSSAMSFYDAPLVLDYGDLEPQASYTLEMVFVASLAKPKPPPSNGEGRLASTAGATGAQPVQLLANGKILKDYFLPPTPMQKLSLQVPEAMTASGKLRVECHERKGLGGTGRTCDIAEVWLRRTE
jgi:hypothetical protein